MRHGLVAMRGTTETNQPVTVSLTKLCVYPLIIADRVFALGIRREISEPYNFQHLTHTHSRHFQQMSRASHHDLISEFSAIRASQAPRRELQGIRAECLQSRALLSEPTSPTRTTLLTPPLSPLRPKQEEPARIPSHQYSQSADYFPQPRPQFYQGRSTTSPIVPPPRRSSRAAVPDFFTHHHEEPVEELDQTPSAPSAPMCSPDRLPATDADDSFAPHAVTTPDNSAFTLKSPPFRVPRPELPDVPEEDDDEKGTATSPSRPSTASSGLRHAMSFPSTKPISQGWSRSPRKVKARDSGSKYSQSEECLSQSEIMLPPLVGEPDDDVPLRPRFSKRVSYKAQGFDACWEDDIDYCYEHAAEADCDFEWDRVSVKDTQDPEDVTTSGAGSITEGYHNCYKTPSPEEISTHHLPQLETSVPSLCSADSAKSSSLSSIAWPATPSCPLPSPRPYGPPSKSSARASANFTFSPPLLVSKDSYSMLHEEAYENIFHKHYHEEPLPLNTLRFDPPSSRDDSPRSSRSPISKCNSHESFMISRSSSLRYPRSTDSMTSLPDLVHSKSSRDVLNLPQEQVFEPAATVKTSDSFVDLQQTPNLTLRQKTSQSLAKEVARQSMLQKAASFGSFDEQEEHEDEQVVILPSVSHHERSQSAAVTQTTEPTYAQRKRSATTATKNRISYSLFPSPPVRTP
jgi:hypothetical protein